MQIITTAHQKGGTGKTTTAALLAQAAVLKEKKVLAIDLDPQGSLTYILGADDTQRGAYSFLEGEETEIQQTAQGIDVIAAEWSLGTMTTSKGSALRLKKALEPLKANYDLIVIDAPPGVGELQYNALQAATGLIMPLLADALSLKAIFRTAKTVSVMQGTNEDLEILGVLINQYDGRSILTRDMKDQIEDRAEALGIPFLGTIRKAVMVGEAAALQRSLFEYAPRSKPAQDFLTVFDKLQI